MNTFLPLWSFGKQIALHLCDWSETSGTYNKFGPEDLGRFVENYTLSFLISGRSPFERRILECPAFQTALNSEDVKDYAAELGKCTDGKRFDALVARILLCCCMDIPGDIRDGEDLYDGVRDLILCYISGLVRILADMCKREHLTAARAFLPDVPPQLPLPDSNAARYAARFTQPMDFEQYGIYDHAAASLKDCYVSPTYSLDVGALDSRSVPLEELLEAFLLGTACPEQVHPTRWLQMAPCSTAVIRGEQGSGKTSILCRLAYDLTHTQYDHSRRFFVVELPSLANTHISVPDKLMDAVLEHLGCDAVVLENTILCLDGLDDLLLLLDQESRTDDCIRRLAEDIANIPSCKCVVTVRSGRISDRNCKDLWTVELHRFSPRACSELIGKYAAVHPAVREHLPGHVDRALWPDLLYSSLALNIPLPDHKDYWSARISQVERQRKENGSDHPRLAVETLAISMRERGKFQECSREAASAYALCEETDVIFLRNAYGLSFLTGGGCCAVRFLSSHAMDYLAARKMANDAQALLRPGAEDHRNLKNWCALFGRFPLSGKFLSYYERFLSRPGERTGSPFPLINATLAGTTLTELLPGNLAGMENYLKNLSGLCYAYRNAVPHDRMDVSALMRWMATAGTLGAKMEQFALLSMDFQDEIQHVSFSDTQILHCAFLDCRVSFCRIHGTISNTQFSNTVFRNCDFSLVDFHTCRFLNCRFEHCDLTETRFRDSAMKDTIFADCDFNHSNTRELRLRNCTFENSRLRLCEFRDLDCCTFRQTDISSASFRGLDLRNTELEDLYISGVYGANLWKKSAAPNLCFKGCSILLRQLKNVYQFLDDISDVTIFQDEAPDRIADPLMVSCEYLFCKGQPIPQEELREFADRFWPDGIKVDT